MYRITFISHSAPDARALSGLLDAGYELTVYGRTVDAHDMSAQTGIHEATSLAEAARNADVVITLLESAEEVEELYCARAGLIDAVRTGAYLIDMTCSSAQLARDIAAAAQICGKAAFDAPICGGIPDDSDVKNTIFFGGSSEEFEPLRPVLSYFADNIVCMGAAGQGQLARQTYQAALSGIMVGVAEAFAFGRAAGLDLGTTFEALAGTPADSGILRALVPKLMHNDFACDYTVAHVVKDLALVLESTEEAQLALPGVELAHELFDTLEKIGAAQMGVQSLELLYEEEASAQAFGLDWSRFDPASDEDPDEDFDLGRVYGLESSYESSL